MLQAERSRSRCVMSTKRIGVFSTPACVGKNPPAGGPALNQQSMIDEPCPVAARRRLVLKLLARARACLPVSSRSWPWPTAPAASAAYRVEPASLELLETPPESLARSVSSRSMRTSRRCSRRVLLKDDREDWSAATISDVADSPIVIYNPANSLGRRSSDIAHELAHVLLRHEPSKLILTPDLTWALRSYDGPAEAEAAWLSGCLLLPRPALLQIAEMDLSSRVAAARYVVSEQLLGYRKAVTAVTRQLERRRAVGRR